MGLRYMIKNRCAIYVVQVALVLSLIVLPFSMPQAMYSAPLTNTTVSIETSGNFHSSMTLMASSPMLEDMTHQATGGEPSHHADHNDGSGCASFCGGALLLDHYLADRFQLKNGFPNFDSRAVELAKWSPPYRPPGTT